MDEPGSLLVRQRRERDRERVRLSSTPARATRDEVGPGRADDEERNLDRPVDEVIDEVEQTVVGPMEILEDQHERPALRERFEEAPPGGEGLRLALAFQVRLAGDSDQRPQVRLDPAHLVRLFEDVFGRGPELRAGLFRRVGLEDSRLPFHHLGQCPERHPLAVRQRPALPPRDQLEVRVDHPEELEYESALADSRDADQRDELGPPLLPRSRQRRGKSHELVLPSDQRRGGPVLDVHPVQRTPLDDPEGRHRFGLAFRLHRLGVFEGDGALGRAVGRLVDQDAVGGGGGLQAGCCVDDVAGGHALPRLRARVQRDERLARGDPDPHLEVARFLGPLADCKRGTDGALRVVLVRDRRAEERHHRVADELLDGPAVPLELVPQALVIRTEDGLHVLRVERLRP